MSSGGLIWIRVLTQNNRRRGKVNRMEAEIVERVAKNVGCEVDTLLANHEQVKVAQGPALRAAGKTDEEVDLMTLRVAAQQIRVREGRLKRSGCKTYEGFFVSVPRYRDWGKLQYDKLTKQLNGLGSEARENLVAQGVICLYERDDVNGGWTMHYNPSLASKQPFEEGADTRNVPDLPKVHATLNDGSSFYAVANKSSPTFPNGGDNFRYGAARRLEELERTSLFLGREQGTKNEPSVITVKTSNDLAKTVFPTFIPGTIALRMSGNGTTAYGKADVTEFVHNQAVATIFSDAPVVINEDGSAGGVIPDLLDTSWLDGLHDLSDYWESLNEKERWDNLCGMTLEVCHIDPRERGGYVVTLGDLDLQSLAPPIDLYVPAVHEDRVDFGVGSLLAVCGNVWRTRDDELRLDISGWWCVQGIAPIETDDDDDEGGWDE